ncbi:hypothetical protein PLESTB_000686500 [Pleodorina starrii]|uniref:Uncharacterized protein n=1 Tax=Pleodorina starrii TaxID=330485 RepID=A0A9W6F217_9CHLO|nr:hypothetical protein PLESTM_001230600 [Pleodorina starrii]GLC52905.1 hypothetical protein PLESTB_000686500 [Pleodorina starrii]GLC65203.1 hypothetical protein PLESTF_000263100 [Pleodorina starrii]
MQRTVTWQTSLKPSRAYSPRTSPAAWPRRPTRCASAASGTARAATVPVWETLVMLNLAPEIPQNSGEQQELLDTFWSLQYRAPGACCASAGPVVQSASRDSSAGARAAVYYRFSSQAQAERFVAGSAFADAKARLLGSGTVSLSLWKVLVPSDMEALFKRGPAFESGVDLVLVLQPASASQGQGQQQQQVVPSEVVVELAGRLQRAAMAANAVQVSVGADVMSLDTKYVWMARFPQEDSAQRFLRSAAVTELAAGLMAAGSSPPAAAAEAGQAQAGGQVQGGLTLVSMALIEVGAVEQSQRRL